LKSELQDLLNP